MNPIIAYILLNTIYALISNVINYFLARFYGVVVRAFTLWAGGYYPLKKQFGEVLFRLGWFPNSGGLSYKIKRDTGKYTRHDCLEFQPVYQQITILNSGSFWIFVLSATSYYIRGLTGLSGLFLSIFAMLFALIFPYYVAKFLAHRIPEKKVFNRLVSAGFYLALLVFAICIYTTTPFFEELFDLFSGNIKFRNHVNTPIGTLIISLAGFMGIQSVFLVRLPILGTGNGVVALGRLKAMHGGYQPTKAKIEDYSDTVILIRTFLFLFLNIWIIYQLLSL